MTRSRSSPGVSTRAAAESAARAGFAVTAIDAFGDLDQHPSVRAVSLAARLYARARRRAPPAASSATRSCTSPASRIIRGPSSALAEGRALWGNAPEVVRRVRDPMLLAEALRKRGFARAAGRNVRLKPDTTYVATRTATRRGPALAGPSTMARQAARLGRRPADSAAGIAASALPRGCYLQEFIEGRPGSVVFVAAGGRAVPLGVSRQLVGDPAFGARDTSTAATSCRRRRPASRDEALVGRGVRARQRGGRGVRPRRRQRHRLRRSRRDAVRDRSEPALVRVDGARRARVRVLGVRRARGRRARPARCPISISRGARRRAPAPSARRSSSRGGTSWSATRARGSRDASIRDIPHPGERIPRRPARLHGLRDGRDVARATTRSSTRRRMYAQLEAWETGTA